MPRYSPLVGREILEQREVEMWRVLVANFYHAHLVTGPASGWRDTTTADWVGAYVDLNALARDRTGYAELMLDLAQREDLPRSWLQSACQWQQSESKLRPSNARRCQRDHFCP